MSYTFNFLLNDKIVSTNVKPSTVLLDFIRKDQHLTSTKEGCREGDCGACTVLVGKLLNGKIYYQSVNSCIFPIVNADLSHIITLEGLSENEPTLIQSEFADALASQCGFCTPGFIISLTCYFLSNKKYNADSAINAVAGNICRCTGYGAIRRAIESIIDKINYDPNISHSENMINNKIVPNCFSQIEEMLNDLVDKRSSEQIILNKNSIIVGGGTDIYVQQRYSIDNKDIFSINKSLTKHIFIEDNELHLYGNVTFEDIKGSKLIDSVFPELKNNLNLVASLPIRNSATIAGNIVNASPIADLTIILICLSARLKLNLSGNTRFISLFEFYRGYKNVEKLDNEIIEEIIFKVPTEHYHYNFEKVSKRTHLDIASVNTAMFVETEHNMIKAARISAGGVSPTPLLLKKTSDLLVNKQINITTISECCNSAMAEISPISDIRGSKEYKSILLKNLIKAHFIKMFPHLIREEELV